eukprot:scaffold48870_cov270-Isochrysis_galbana.AAC.4
MEGWACLRWLCRPVWGAASSQATRSGETRVLHGCSDGSGVPSAGSPAANGGRGEARTWRASLSWSCSGLYGTAMTATWARSQISDKSRSYTSCGAAPSAAPPKKWTAPHGSARCGMRTHAPPICRHPSGASPTPALSMAPPSTVSAPPRPVGDTARARAAATMGSGSIRAWPSRRGQE